MKEKRNKDGWNYRIIKMPDKKLKGCPQTYSYGIYEVYYTNDKPTSWSENPMYPIGEEWNDLYSDYHLMFGAFTKKVLHVKDDKLVEGQRFR